MRCWCSSNLRLILHVRKWRDIWFVLSYPHSQTSTTISYYVSNIFLPRILTRQNAPATGTFFSVDEGTLVGHNFAHNIGVLAGRKEAEQPLCPTEWIYHAMSKFQPMSHATTWLLAHAEKAKQRTPGTDIYAAA